MPVYRPTSSRCRSRKHAPRTHTIRSFNYYAHHQECHKPITRNYNVPVRALSTANMPSWIKHLEQYNLLLSEIPRYSFIAHFEIMEGGLLRLWKFYQTVAVKFFDIAPVVPWQSLWEVSKNRTELIQNAEFVVLRSDIIGFFTKLRKRSRRVISSRLKDHRDFADVDKIEYPPSRTFRPTHPDLDWSPSLQSKIY